MRSVDLHWGLLAQLAGCVLPAMAAVFVAKPLLGAQYTLASLLAVLGYHVVRRDRFAFGCIVLGSLPVLALMRGLFFYYGEVALLGGTCLMWLALSPERLVHLWRDQAWRWMTVGLLVFWWLSMLMTGSYATNLRSFEVILGSACVVLVAERRSYLATALVGMVMSAAALGFGLLPYGDRLGQGVVGETSIGNPILLGMPCALLVVISLADSGRWMLVERRLVLRIVLCLTMAELLILSGSRGSWVAALSGLDGADGLQPARSQDSAGGAWRASRWSPCSGSRLAEDKRSPQQFEKTVDSDRTLANRTSGRSVQWSVIPQVFAESPIWGWGPGSGKDVAAIYTGRHLGWHALYLQMIGETGLIGTSLLFVFLGALVLRGVRHWKTSPRDRAFGEHPDVHGGGRLGFGTGRDIGRLCRTRASGWRCRATAGAGAGAYRFPEGRMSATSLAPATAQALGLLVPPGRVVDRVQDEELRIAALFGVWRISNRSCLRCRLPRPARNFIPSITRARV